MQPEEHERPDPATDRDADAALERRLRRLVERYWQPPRRNTDDPQPPDPK